nr:putative ribonuclease H-like domain-containing protein [Tanacetum cinerariifolium]
MVKALMYLTASRPEIVHATCYCARYQAKPTKKHLTAVKWIFRYLKDTINMGLWYPKDTGFDLTAFSDSDSAGCLDSPYSDSDNGGAPQDCKSTTGGSQFLVDVESPIPTVSSPVPTACLNDSPESSSKARLISKRVANQEESPSLDNILSLTNRFEDILGVTTSSNEAIGVEADVSNMETSITASSTHTLRINKDHPKSQIIGLMDTLIQTRHKSKVVEEQSFIATIYQKKYPTLLQFCLFSCFLSQIEPKKTLVDCPKGFRPIGTKWVLKNKKNERGIVVRNKSRLVAQGHTQEEGIDYDEVFVPVVRIEAIRLFLAYASFMGFTVYQMDVKSAFLYGTIDEEVYVMQPPGF